VTRSDPIALVGGPPQAGLPQTRPTRSVALVGTYPPTACGLATFTSNLRAAISPPGSGWDAKVVRILDRWEPERCPHVVAHWVAGDHASLARALDVLASFDAVLLQHEYGVFPGADGEQVLDLVAGVQAPLVAVVHTALQDPSPRQRAILDRVIDAAAVVVVQSEAARQRILSVHGRDPDEVVTIPHGAAENFTGPTRACIPRPSVLTWGLLSPGKGIEHGIAALARLEPHSPAVSYIVAGRTHPKVRAAHGERYRQFLQARARELGVADRVRFDGGYYDWDSLRALVRSVNVVLLPYESRDQASSGVLVEAVASGRPVVATRFPHAEELLADGAGILVDHGDVDAIAAALARVLDEPGLAERMAAAARRAARRLLWPVVGDGYRQLIDRAVRERVVA
jgi:polysaccharide biosynthesis protein PslF